MSDGDTPPDDGETVATSGRADGGPLRRRVTIVNTRGLHARAAAKFAKAAGAFEARITVTKGDQTVSGLSIMGLMMLAAAPGSDLELSAEGADAEAALAALAALIDDKFEEDGDGA